MKTTPTRFVLARMRRGLFVWQVADACRIARKRMHAIESGHCDPRKKEVLAVSDYLRFPPAFFSRPHVDIPRLEQTSIRA